MNGTMSKADSIAREVAWPLYEAEITELKDRLARYSEQEDRFIEIIDALETDVRMLKAGEPSTTLKEFRKLSKWKEALEDVFIINWIDWDEDNPKTAIYELLTQTTIQALDPRISQLAVDLIEQYGGRYNAEEKSYSSAPLSDKPIGMGSCCDRTPPGIVFGEAKLSSNPDDLSWR